MTQEKRSPLFFRLRLMLSHLGVSFFLLASVFAVFWFRWYASPNWYLSGADRVFGLVVMVDLAIGPLTTLVIANSRKRWQELARDLTIIGVMQLSALGWGAHALWQARPLYTVFSADRFELVQANQITDEAESKATKSGARFAPDLWKEAQWAWAKPPSDPEERREILFSAALAQVDISTMPYYFRSLDEGREAILERAASYQSLHQALQKIEPATQLPQVSSPDTVEVLPIVGRERNGIVLIDKASLKMVGFVRVDPYSLTIWPKKKEM